MADESYRTVPPEHQYHPPWEDEEPESTKRQRLPVTAGLDFGLDAGRELQALLVGYRQRLGIPVIRVAEAMGIRDSVVWRFETNVNDARLSTILRYAKCLGLDLELVEKEKAIA